MLHIHGTNTNEVYLVSLCSRKHLLVYLQFGVTPDCAQGYFVAICFWALRGFRHNMGCRSLNLVHAHAMVWYWSSSLVLFLQTLETYIFLKKWFTQWIVTLHPLVLNTSSVSHTAGVDTYRYRNSRGASKRNEMRPNETFPSHHLQLLPSLGGALCLTLLEYTTNEDRF